MAQFQIIFIKSLSATRGNRYKIMQKHVHYNLTKFSFSNRTASIWNSLVNYVVSACSIMIFGKRLDYFWKDQECSRENENWLDTWFFICSVKLEVQSDSVQSTNHYSRVTQHKQQRIRRRLSSNGQTKCRMHSH